MMESTLIFRRNEALYIFLPRPLCHTPFQNAMSTYARCGRSQVGGFWKGVLAERLVMA